MSRYMNPITVCCAAVLALGLAACNGDDKAASMTEPVVPMEPMEPQPTPEEIAAATRAAATKRTAIAAEAGQADDAGLGGSSAPAPSAAGSYSLSIERDDTETMIEIGVREAPESAPEFVPVMDLGDGRTMLVRAFEADSAGSVVEEVVVLGTDIDEPAATPFATVPGQTLNVSTNTANDTPSVTHEAFRIQAGSASVLELIDAEGFTGGPGAAESQQLSFNFDNTSTADQDEADEVRGTYNGAQGTYRCNGSAQCTVTSDSEGEISSMSAGWVFTPDPGATSPTQDEEFLHYGFWLMRTTDREGAVNYDEVQTFAGSSVARSGSLATVTGRATYAGGATGVYVRTRFKPTDATIDTATSGHFSADANLTAHFGQFDKEGCTRAQCGAIAPYLLNSVTGTIDNFQLSGGEQNAWSVALEGETTPTTGLVSGTTDPGETGSAGEFSAAFHGPTADSDNNPIHPHTLVGEFNANFGNGVVAGAFGARKQ